MDPLSIIALISRSLAWSADTARVHIWQGRLDEHIRVHHLEVWAFTTRRVPLRGRRTFGFAQHGHNIAVDARIAASVSLRQCGAILNNSTPRIDQNIAFAMVPSDLELVPGLLRFNPNPPVCNMAFLECPDRAAIVSSEVASSL